MRIESKAIIVVAVTAILLGCGGGGGGGGGSAAAAKTLVMSPGSATNTVWNVNAADLNGDGLEDVVVSGWKYDVQTAYVYIFIQNPDGSLTDKTQSLLANNVIQGSQRVLIKDFDGDGHTDIFIPGFSDGSAIVPANSVMLWGGSSNFTRQDLSDQVEAHGACIADMNGDGRPDMIISGSWRGTTGGVYINNGDRTFTINSAVMPYGNNYFAACAVIPGTSTNTIYFGVKQGAAPHDSVAVYDHALNLVSNVGYQNDATLDTTDVIATDLNQDGKMDFITIANGLNVGVPGPIQLLESDNTGQFAATQTLATLRSQYYGRPLSIDGVNSIYISGDSNNAAIFKGLTRYKPTSFSDMAATNASFITTGLYKNNNSGKIFMLELLNNSFYTSPL